MSVMWRQPIEGIWMKILSVSLMWITYLFMVEYAKCSVDAFLTWVCIAFSVNVDYGFSIQKIALKQNKALISSIVTIIFQTFMTAIAVS